MYVLYLVNLNSESSIPFSSSPTCVAGSSIHSKLTLPPHSQTPQQQQAPKPWVWRMMAQPESRKYQLFPREKPATPAGAKGLDPEQAFALAMGQNGDKSDKPSVGNLRLRMKEHNLNLVRRRKVSVPELGPMTTVHEASMDSRECPNVNPLGKATADEYLATIPGRPAFHERSASAPGNSWKQHHPAFKTNTEQTEPTASGVARPPVSPKDLPPLVIPTHSQPSNNSPLKTQLSLSRLRSGSIGSNEPTTRADSPKMKTPFTPSSAVMTPLSTTTTAYSAMSMSTLPTPVSVTAESRASPKSWRSDAALDTPKEQPTDLANNMATPQSAVEYRSESSFSMHRRNVSDSGSIAGSIMDRGRPKKKGEIGLKRTASKRDKSAERRAFEHLPKGWKATDAVQMLDASETAALNRQAVQQAERFEILRKADVDSLSRVSDPGFWSESYPHLTDPAQELRNLDERCEYLRRTYHSLRAGRRNLHSRICQYLRSPRMVKFSQESLLKQEEALAELDASIDDWVNKLEQAENRRTRVRQKLLEHVAAAVTLPGTAGSTGGASGALQLALGLSTPSIPPNNITTPPRSPTRASAATHYGSSSPSPHRVVAQVPSTITEQPMVEEAAVGLGINQHAESQKTDAKKPEANEPLTAGIRRAEVESIRIYAGDEVAALLADVEQQITRMSKASEANAALREKDAAALREKETTSVSEEERKEIHRAASHEALQGGPDLRSTSSSSSSSSSNTTKSPTTFTPRSATPSTVEAKNEDHPQFILSAAVFNPQTAVAH